MTEGLSSGGEGHGEKVLRSRVEITGAAKEGQEVAIFDGKKGGSLNPYLPKGVSFMSVPGGLFRYYEGRRDRPVQDEVGRIPRVEFPPEKLSTLNGRLALLHEMGHGICLRNKGFEQKRYHAYLLGIANSIIESVRQSNSYREASPEMQNITYIEEFKKAWTRRSREEQYSGLSPLRYKDLSAAIRARVEWEKASWEEALALRSRIAKDTGIDLFEGADTKQLIAHIEAVNLGSYERAYGPILELAGEKDPVSSSDWFDRILNSLIRRIAG